MKTTLIKNIGECVTLAGVHKKAGRNLLPEDLNIIKDAAIVHDGEVILWVGKKVDLPKQYTSAQQVIDAKRGVVLPEIIDCHTHLVFAGDRADEYVLRLSGATYESIARGGGGILRTTTATRLASKDSLFASGLKRIDNIAQMGATTIEIKTGYGLDRPSELKCLQVIEELKQHFAPKGIRIISTFMAAHAVPKEFTSGKEYIKQLVIPMLGEINTDFVDIFIEENYFSHQDAELLFAACKKLNLPFKAHVDELKNSKSLKFAVEAGATSCEHMLYADDESIKALAQSDSIGVLLPGTAFFLGKTMAPARKMLDAGARLAIGSDFNPGSCHWGNLLQMAKMSAPTLKLNIAELICSITYNAALALKLEGAHGIIPGAKPRFYINPEHQSLSELIYSW